ncbi:MAG: hypothetical protein WA130_04270 [Candidatus Methanoperedens sp.]
MRSRTAESKHVSDLDLETGKRFMENFNDLIDVKKLSRKLDAVPVSLYHQKIRKGIIPFSFSLIRQPWLSCPN